MRFLSGPGVPFLYASNDAKDNITNIIVTPSGVHVSSKHILSISGYGDCVPFPVTPIVECLTIPAVNGGTETQLPLPIITNNRFKELLQFRFIGLVP